MFDNGLLDKSANPYVKLYAVCVSVVNITMPKLCQNYGKSTAA